MPGASTGPAHRVLSRCRQGPGSSHGLVAAPQSEMCAHLLVCASHASRASSYLPVTRPRAHRVTGNWEGGRVGRVPRGPWDPQATELASVAKEVKAHRLEHAHQAGPPHGGFKAGAAPHRKPDRIRGREALWPNHTSLLVSGTLGCRALHTWGPEHRLGVCPHVNLSTCPHHGGGCMHKPAPVLQGCHRLSGMWAPGAP